MSGGARAYRQGMKFGPYVLGAPLERSGPGEVYDAVDTRDGRNVVLRLLSATMTAAPGFMDQLASAVRQANEVRDPRLTKVNSIGVIDGSGFVESAVVNAESLRNVLTRVGALSPTRSVAVVQQVAAALDAVHAAGMVHSDISPETISITSEDRVVLDDLAVASMTGTGRFDDSDTTAAAHAYTAPERFTTGVATPAGDVYSLACVLFECLTGTRPFPGDTVAAVISAHLTLPVPRPHERHVGVPAAFDDVCARGMAKEPRARYAGVGELAVAAETALVAAPASAVAAAPMSKGPREQPLPFHQDVQFTAYRPRVVSPFQWTPLLAFAHLGETPLGSDPRDDPLRQVQQRAQAILGDRMDTFAPLTQDSAVGLPEEAEVTFELELSSFDIRAPRRTFLWINAVHMEEFHIRAVADLRGGTARGQLRVFHGSILLASVGIAIKVDSQLPQGVSLGTEPASAAPFRKIFPSYSHLDTPIVVQFERYMEAIGDRYLRDVRTLRSGEIWNDRLCDFIRDADVFQLFWSRNAMTSRFVEQEWRYALALNRREFIRPTYWEDPLPTAPGLPPDELGRVHFHQLGAGIKLGAGIPAPPVQRAPAGSASLPPPPVQRPVPSMGSQGPWAMPVPPPAPPTSSSRRRAQIGIGGAIAAVIVGGLGSVGLMTGTNTAWSPPDATSAQSPTYATQTRTATRTTSASPPPTLPGDLASMRLLRLLPAGYGTANCQIVASAPGSLASVKCGPIAAPGAPLRAAFSLFRDSESLEDHFALVTPAAAQLRPCPGNTQQSPTTWSATAAPQEVAGQLACDALGGLLWTRRSDGLLAETQGDDLPAMYRWWLDVR